MSTKFSIRKAVLLLAGFGAVVGGCQRANQYKPDPISQKPIEVDAAMARRNWDQTTVYYPNGNAVAYGTGLRNEVRPDNQEWTYAIWSPVMFAGQAVWLPFGVIRDRAWREREYQGVQIPPTYTAMPNSDKSSIVYDKPIPVTGRTGPADDVDLIRVNGVRGETRK